MKATGADVARGFLDYGRPLAIAARQFCVLWFCHIVSFWFEPPAASGTGPGAGWRVKLILTQKQPASIEKVKNEAF